VPPVALRPRSTTELIDAAVQLLRQHYVELVTITAIFLMPAILLSLLVPDVRTGTMPVGGQIWTVLGGVLVAVVFALVSTAAIVIVVSDSYLGRDISIGSAVQRVFARFWSVFFVAIFQTLAVGLGFIFFIIPGFYLLGAFFASTVVVMIEGKSTFAAMGRSYHLASGSVGRILGVLILTGIIVGVIQAIIAVGIALLARLVGLGTSFTNLATNIVHLFIYPFATVVLTLLYYDLRIRKEGFDLEVMAAELGARTAPAPTA
jgi:hypothetical protein